MAGVSVYICELMLYIYNLVAIIKQDKKKACTRMYSCIPKDSLSLLDINLID